MTWVDFAVIGVIAISALLAFMRGLVREVLGIGAWVGAGLAAISALPLVRPQFHQWMGTSPWADPAAFVAIFVVALIVLMLVAHLIGRLVRRSALGGLDRTLGLVFGVARGVALVIIAYIIVGLVKPVDQWPDAVLQARSIGLVYDGAKWAADHVPQGSFRAPPVYPPPAGRKTTSEALLHATPQGSALARPVASPAARD
jgi:membrane protein required for colicin V production